MSDDPYKSFDHHIKALEAEITRLAAALAGARREGMEEAADLCDDLPDHQGGICAIAIRMMIDEEDKKAAIRAAGEDRERLLTHLDANDTRTFIINEGGDLVGLQDKSEKDREP